MRFTITYLLDTIITSMRIANRDTLKWTRQSRALRQLTIVKFRVA